MAEFIEAISGPTMRDEVGRLPTPEAPAPPLDEQWRLDRAAQKFVLGALHVELRFEAPWAWVSPQVDGRAGPFVLDNLQRELNEATAGLATVQRLPGLEAAAARAAARKARRDELEAERQRLLGADGSPDDLAERLEGLDRELAGLVSAEPLAARLAKELDSARARALRDVSMVNERLNQQAVGDLLALRAAAGRALAQLPGLEGALLSLVTASRLSEAASACRLGDVQAALAAARRAAPETPPDGPGDPDAGGGPGPGPDAPDAPPPTPGAATAAPGKTFDDYLSEAFAKAKAKLAAEEDAPPPPPTVINRVFPAAADRDGAVTPAPADDSEVVPQLPDDLDDAALVAGPGGPDAPAPSPLATFILERCECGDDREVEVGQLLESFNSWAFANGAPPFVGPQELGKALRLVVAGVEVVRHQVGDERPRFFRGVGLRPVGP
jgi:hypothetical protein